MKIEEFRQAIPSDDRTPLPKGEQGPCMCYVIDMEIYNATGETVMIEQPTEFIPPVKDEVTQKAEAINRRRPVVMSKRPPKEVLEKLLRSGMSAAEIAEKYNSVKITVYNWIRSYELQGIKGQGKPRDEVQEAHPVDNEIVQHSPTLAEIEQFHTDNPVQELPVVEMGPEPDLYPCAKCGKGFWTDGHSTLCVDCSESLANQGMTAEENMTDEEWEVELKKISSKDAVIPDPAPRETFDEIWQDVRDDLATLERLYVAQAKKSFRERLREMLAEVVGEVKV